MTRIKIRFAVTFRGRDIFSYSVPRAGLQCNAIFEWRQAAKWAGVEWSTFCDLDGYEQSAIVAQYLTHMQLEAVLEQDRIQRERALNRRTRGK